MKPLRRIRRSLNAACLGMASILIAIPARVSVGQTVSPVIERTIADWQKRFDRVKAVRYTVEGNHVIPKDAFTDDDGRPIKAPPGARDTVCAIRRELLLDLAGNRYRMDRDEQIYSYFHKAVIQRKTTSLFDGAKLMGLFKQIPPNPVFPKAPPTPDATIATGYLKFAAFEGIHWPMLFGHGIVQILGGPNILQTALRQEYDPELLVFHGESVEDGVRCNVLRSRTLKSGNVIFTEIAVDPKRDSAVLRYLQSSNGEPHTNTTIQYRQTSAGWLPAAWTFSLYNSRQVSFTETLKVSELQLDPNLLANVFELNLKPGMLVKKTEYGIPTDDGNPNPITHEERYRVNDRSDLVPVVFWDGQEHSKGWPSWSYLAVALVVAALYIAGLVYRRNRRLAA